MTTKYKDFVFEHCYGSHNFVYNHKTISNIKLAVRRFPGTQIKYEYYFTRIGYQHGMYCHVLANIYPNDISEEHLNLILLKELSES